MIKVTQIIQLLRQHLPTWSVEGAIDLSIAEDASRLPLPALYVGLAPTVYENTSQSTYEQTYTQNFFILSCTPTKEGDDRTGKYGQDFVPTILEYLLRILVNNKDLDPDSHVIMMRRDAPEKLDRARYYHKFEFTVEGRLLPEDVHQLELDYFDKLFVDYVVDGSTDGTPSIQQEIKPIYFT
jgi:hypothetical protein